MKLGKRCSMITDMNGTKTIMRDGKIHRKGGPAIEYISGDHYWYIDGLLHREDGPAYEGMHTGYKQWYLNGVQYTEENHKRKLAGDELIPVMNNWSGGTGFGGDVYTYSLPTTYNYWTAGTSSIYVGGTNNQTSAYINQTSAYINNQANAYLGQYYYTPKK